MKEKRRGDLSKFLNGENWTFIKDGLDDFRDGLPPIVDGSSVLSVSLCNASCPNPACIFHRTIKACHLILRDCLQG